MCLNKMFAVVFTLLFVFFVFCFFISRTICGPYAGYEQLMCDYDNVVIMQRYKRKRLRKVMIWKYVWFLYAFHRSIVDR